jgi:hypothetical protein
MLTEEEWHISNDPQAMLGVLRGCAVATERKCRLYACTCAELAISQLPNRADYQHILTIAEKTAEGSAQHIEVQDASKEGISLEINSTTRTIARIAAAVSCTLERESYTGACRVLDDLLHEDLAALELVKRELYAHLLRCIFGNPYRGYKVGFRPVALNPAWRTSDAIALARGIYDDRAFDRMPILADALQDAGCDNDDILTHCRDTRSPHARGCWVVDLVLGK